MPKCDFTIRHWCSPVNLLYISRDIPALRTLHLGLFTWDPGPETHEWDLGLVIHRKRLGTFNWDLIIYMWDLIGTTPALFLVSYEYIKATINY